MAPPKKYPAIRTCQYCYKDFKYTHVEQLYCNKAFSSADRKGKTIQRNKHHVTTSAELAIQQFYSAHPTTTQEVLQDESVPNRGLVRNHQSKSCTDLHSVLNKRKVRSRPQEIET